MNRNPILEELYAVRERLLAEAGGDIHQLLVGIRHREAAYGRLLEPRIERESGLASCRENGYGEPAGQTAQSDR